MKNVITVSTHDGFFHADEIFALAVLRLWAERGGKQIEIVRSREKDVFEKADMVVDIGGVYDRKTNHFDHHQIGGAGKRKNGIAYAAFGLIWKHFGEKITSKEAARMVETKLVMPIDAIDNGINLATSSYEGVSDYTLSKTIWAIGESGEKEEVETLFNQCLDFACLIIRSEVKKAELAIKGELAVEKEIKQQREPVILVLPSYYPWVRAVSQYKKIKFVAFPNKGDERWCIQAARDDSVKFGNDRASFPESWRGLADEELEKASGVIGASFCHKGGFFAIGKTSETAMELGKKALA